MKFELIHEFPFAIDEVERRMFHPDTPPLMKRGMPLLTDIELLEARRDGNQLKRRMRYQPKPVIDSVGGKKIEPEWMEWIEDSSYDFGTHKGTFLNVPVKRRIAEVFDNHGTLRFEPTATGCRRVILGELNIKVFVLGKVAERLIYPHAKNILDQEAAFLAGLQL